MAAAALSTSVAGRTLTELLSDFPILEKMPGASIQAQFIVFRILFLSTLQQADPSDTFGCVGAFLSPEDFTVYQEIAPGQVAEIWQRHPHPGNIHPQATAVDIYLHRIALDNYNNEAALLFALQHKLSLSLPGFMRSGFISAVSGVARLGTPTEQWAKIILLVGPLSTSCVTKEHAFLLNAYRVGTPLREFFEVHDAGHRFRSMVKMPYAQYEMFELAKNALESSGIFTISLRQFVELHPELVDQNYERFKTLMLRVGDGDLQALKANLSTAHAVTGLEEKVQRLKAKLAALSGNPKPAPPVHTKTHFCWTCGSQTGHPSYA